MKIVQSQKYQGDDWWNWSVWIDGGKSELDSIEKVVWKLHPTFPQPVLAETNREKQFRLDTGGWGTFRVRAEVVRKDGQTEKLVHELELPYPDPDKGTKK